MCPAHGDSISPPVLIADTYGKTISYEYDACGNLTRVTDWAGRVTAYTYDANNRVAGVANPDGSTTTTVYDSMQRVTSTVEKTAGGAVISGFEYTYNDLRKLPRKKHLPIRGKYAILMTISAG